MPENKQVKSKPGFFARLFDGLRTLPSRIAKRFKNMTAELRKVAWPSRKDLVNYSLVVIAFVGVLSIIVGALDFGSSALIQLLIGR